MGGQIIHHQGGGTSFNGPDAVDAFRIASLRSALGLLKAGIGMRGLTKTRALELAGQYTGVKYKRGEFDKAREDLSKILDIRKKHIDIVKN